MENPEALMRERVLLWQGIQGIFNETDTVGFAVFSIGLIILGVAMLKTPAFGKVIGGLSVAIGVASVLGISFFAVDSSARATMKRREKG